MLLKDFLPSPDVRQFVSCYRIVHLIFDETAEFPFKAYPPKPEECLLFYLRDGEVLHLKDTQHKVPQEKVIFTGQQSSLMKRYAGKNFLNFQIVFQPGAFFRLSGIAGNEVADLCLDAAEVFTREISYVLEELQEAESYDKMMATADKFVKRLMSSAREAHRVDKIALFMKHYDGNVSLDWLASECCFSVKHFRRLFNERIGLNPKLYSRIIRLTKAFNIKNAHPEWDWLRVALECNYYDYPHLVKDYRELCGYLPKELHLLEGNSPENRLGLTSFLYPSRLNSFPDFV